jgi:hypothetical protein
MDKSLERLAILFRLKISRVENGNYEPIFNRHFNEWQFKLSYTKELFSNDLAPSFNESGEITNATYSKININGLDLTETDFVSHEIESLEKLNRDVLKPYEKVTFDGYLKYVKNRINKANKKSELPNYCFIGALFAQGFIKKDKGYFYYKDEKFRNASDLHKRISNEINKDFGIKIEATSIKPYVSDSLTGGYLPKNFYNKKTLHRNILKFCEKHDLLLTPEFKIITNN